MKRNLQELRENGIKYESPAAGEEKISGRAINKIRPYSFRNLKKCNNPKKNDETKKCYRCGSPFKPNHIKDCKAINLKCLNCGKIGHFASLSTKKC